MYYYLLSHFIRLLLHVLYNLEVWSRKSLQVVICVHVSLDTIQRWKQPALFGYCYSAA
jgi:hypothetical protein